MAQLKTRKKTLDEEQMPGLKNKLVDKGSPQLLSHSLRFKTSKKNNKQNKSKKTWTISAVKEERKLNHFKQLRTHVGSGHSMSTSREPTLVMDQRPIRYQYRSGNVWRSEFWAGLGERCTIAGRGGSWM